MLTIHPISVSVFCIDLKGRLSITIKDLCQVNLHFFFKSVMKYTFLCSFYITYFWNNLKLWTLQVLRVCILKEQLFGTQNIIHLFFYTPLHFDTL